MKAAPTAMRARGHVKPRASISRSADKSLDAFVNDRASIAGGERVGAVPDGLPHGVGGALPDPREELQRPLPGELVLGVDEDLEEREHVLDVSLLEKSRPRADLVGDAPPRQLDLELQRLVMRPIEHGEVRKPLPFIVPLEQPLPDETGLLRDVRQGHDARKEAGGTGGRQLLGELPDVVGDRGVCQSDVTAGQHTMRLRAA